MRRRWVLLSAALGVLGTGQARAAINDANFVETEVVKIGANGMTAMAWAPDGSNRLFVTRKSGQVLIIQDGALLATPFATITPLITAGESGLLGIAFDPKFLENGYVYFFVTVSATEQQIVRLTASGNSGSGQTVIVSGLATRGGNHNGGALGFGPDGKLYWAVGDNAGDRSGTRGDLLSSASKVGRANPDGSAPQDNPFFDAAGPNNDYIWARGFRNPFSLTFQPTTGQLWLNVVGSRYEQVFQPQAGDNGGWDQYEANQPAGFLAPNITYDTNGATPRAITATGATRAGGVVTISTAVAHRLRPGAKITIADVTDPTFNGAFTIATTAAQSFTYLQAEPNATSGNGTATPQNIGGCPTGAAFWDSSAVPAAYRGNFMFGDYVTGRMMRVQLGASNQVAAIDEWGTGFGGITDMALGPDGDLYYMRIAGFVNRARYTLASQALVVSPLNQRMAEAGSAVVGVRLGVEPINPRTVNVQWLSGDTDVSVVEGASLAFDASNWSVPQRVVLSAASDSDSVEDEARIRVASAGLTAQVVTVRVTDDESFSMVVSPGELEVDEGDSAQLEVSLTQPPPAPLQLSVARTSGDTSASVSGGAQLSFDASNWSVPQLVTVSAAEDADAVSGTATLTLSGSGLPSREVEVTVDDNDALSPEFTSTPVGVAVVGAPYEYDADAEGFPEPVYALVDAPDGMTIDPTTGEIAWTPALVQDESVTVSASNGIDPDALQTFEITVAADEPPTCALTAPVEGALLEGDGAEFFGDVFDDVGAVRAEFSIDDVIGYEDVNAEGHYHFGGTHNLFDTTALSDGQHVLSMKGYDTAGQSCTASVTVTVQNGAVGAGGAGAGGAAGGGGIGAAAGEAPVGEGGTSAPADGGEPGAPASGGDNGSGPMASGGDDASGGEPPSGSGGGSDSGCGCRTAAGAGAPGSGAALGLLLVGLAGFRRRWRAKG